MTEYTSDDIYWMTEAMVRYGGSFVKILGKAIRTADDENQKRAISAWPEYVEQYHKIGQKIKAEDVM